jgi:hypothetical protein
MKQFGFGGIDLVRCLLLRYEETGLVGCDHIRTGSGTWTEVFRKDQRRDALPLASR